MDKNFDYNNLGNNFGNNFANNFGYYSPQYDTNDNSYFDNFNPVMQYEQAYMYYRYMTQQLEYKIKCKEYENLCSSPRQ